MTIDTSKIKPGDTGTIRVMFGSEAREFVAVAFGTMDDGIFSQQVPASIIASHTPAPWVPEKGDVVVIWDSSAPEWKVLAIDGEAIWIGYGKDHMTTTAKHLTLIRKEAA